MDRKIYLNIQQQVEKNKNDIKAILEGAVVLADFGIKVIGSVDEASELPDPDTYDGEYGDAYTVGTEAPYDMYIFTRPLQEETSPRWFNVGEFPKPGPQGEQGEQGFTPYIGDNGNWFINGVDTGEPSRGEQGPQGVEGPVGQTGSQGIQGIQGPQGPQGPTGPSGPPGSFNIIGRVDNASLLPAASGVSNTSAYAVGTVTPYDVYVIITENGVKSWLNMGPVAVIDSDTKIVLNTWNTSGTLTTAQLNELVNTPTMDFIKIGNRFFCKSDTTTNLEYFNILEGTSILRLSINSSTGVWSITTIDFTKKLYWHSLTISGLLDEDQNTFISTFYWADTYSGVVNDISKLIDILTTYDYAFFKSFDISEEYVNEVYYIHDENDNVIGITIYYRTSNIPRVIYFSNNMSIISANTTDFLDAIGTPYYL